MKSLDNRPRWEVLEDWMIDSEITRFTAGDLASNLDLSVKQASQLINAHLIAQRHKNSKTLFVLKRKGRTRNAVWSGGERTVDVDILKTSLFEDLSVRIKKAFVPDLERIRDINPQTARKVGHTLDGLIDGALVVMAATLNGVEESEA